MLIGGLICNYLIKPVDMKWNMSAEELAKLQAVITASQSGGDSFGIGRGGIDAPALLFWAFVGIPICWGAWITLLNAARLF